MMPTTRSEHPVGSDRAGGTPRSIAWMDGRVVPASEATVPLTDEGFLRGDAVFEAILVRNGRTHELDAHLARMRRSAQTLSLRLPVMRQVVKDLLAGWGDHDGTMRLVATRSGTIRGLLSFEPKPESLSLAVVEMSWRSALAGAKTLSYAVNQWATRQARDRDADDAVIVDEGRVLELPTAAIGLVSEGRIFAPDHETLPILDSITMQALSSVVEIQRTTPKLDDLTSAEELFVVSATRPVLPVHAVLVGDDEHRFDAPGPMTKVIRERFGAHIDATLDEG